MVFLTIIFPFIRDTANSFQVDSHAGDSKNKIVTRVVRFGAAVATAFHDMDSWNNHHNNLNNLDNNDNFCKQQIGSGMVVCCFKVWDIDLITDMLRKPFMMTTWGQIQDMGLNLGLYFGCPDLGLNTW